MAQRQDTQSLKHTVCSGIATLFDDAASSDIAIKARDTTVHAHKIILAAQSPYFRAMFQVSIRQHLQCNSTAW